jgi:hypothetical protein
VPADKTNDERKKGGEHIKLQIGPRTLFYLPLSNRHRSIDLEMANILVIFYMHFDGIPSYILFPLDAVFVSRGKQRRLQL